MPRKHSKPDPEKIVRRALAAAGCMVEYIAAVAVQFEKSESAAMAAKREYERKRNSAYRIKKPAPRLVLMSQMSNGRTGTLYDNAAT